MLCALVVTQTQTQTHARRGVDPVVFFFSVGKVPVVARTVQVFETTRGKTGDVIRVLGMGFCFHFGDGKIVRGESGLFEL